MRLRYRQAVAAVVAVICASTLAACSTTSSSSTSSKAASRSPVTLGAIETITGPFAQVGQSKVAGMRLAIKEINKAGGADGHKLVLVVKDEEASPTVTVTDVRELLGAGVKLIMGGDTDSDCLAAAPIINSAGGMFVGTSCQSNLLETTKFVPSFFEIAPSNYMLSEATAMLAATKFGNVKMWDGVGPDYSFGQEVWASFKKDLKKLQPGVTFPKNVLIPLSETQFDPYISSLLSGLPANSAQSTGLFMSTFGATTVGLAKQGASYNLFGKFKAVLNLGGSTPTAQALGPSTPPLWFIYDYYSGAYHNAMNTKFISAYEAANGGQLPNAWAYEGYTAVLAYAAAIEKSHSTSVPTLIKTMAGMTFDTPKGPLTFRKQDHLLESPVTVWHVVGDSSAPSGFKVTSYSVIPASKVLPPVDVS